MAEIALGNNPAFCNLFSNFNKEFTLHYITLHYYRGKLYTFKCHGCKQYKAQINTGVQNYVKQSPSESFYINSSFLTILDHTELIRSPIRYVKSTRVKVASTHGNILHTNRVLESDVIFRVNIA
uniref:Uncharacterized protein n=1 Tax=Cacopsylla melanoneura TaxID=428564 RepID=A0A8D8TU14_9HEMI